MEDKRKSALIILVMAAWFLAVVSLIVSLFLLFGCLNNKSLLLPTAIVSLACLFFWAFAYWDKKEERLKKSYNIGILSIYLIFIISAMLTVHYRYFPFPELGAWLLSFCSAVLCVFVFWVGIKLKQRLLKRAGY